ncbi:hypothetical protein C4D60_Mb07t03530 [Musa balbisiana]|uniref:Uncharacterized protein n=1 Tax=Musa balbisiana TaxID=52838 RepID=A0A4S8JEJ3_MUSBA|nr:hypothetical protein C4D60_Mb07t03530 [Musa balbisiana]
MHHTDVTSTHRKLVSLRTTPRLYPDPLSAPRRVSHGLLEASMAAFVGKLPKPRSHAPFPTTYITARRSSYPRPPFTSGLCLRLYSSFESAPFVIRPFLFLASPNDATNRRNRSIER